MVGRWGFLAILNQLSDLSLQFTDYWQGKRILTIFDKMNFMWVAYPEVHSGIFEENLPSQLLSKNRPNVKIS
jgi:hypothetical protein